MDPEDRKKFEEESKAHRLLQCLLHYHCCFPLLDVSPFPVTSAIPKVIKAGYAHLNLKYFFTAGPDEVRAWTIMVSEVEGRSTFVP